ncbi:MAG: lytic transglycosylase domain-containing protein [bacterium]
MFSQSIDKLIQSSSIKSAQERVLQIETILADRINAVSPTLPKINGNQNDVNLPKFSDYMKTTPPQGLKYKVAELPSLSKGQIQEMVTQISEKYKIDNKLVMALIQQESNFNTSAVSKSGAMGLMQLMPSTAKTLGVLNPFSAEQNIEGGVKHLKNMLAKYNGNLILALAAYNAGGGSVDKYGGVPPYKETQNYVKKILANYLG